MKERGLFIAMCVLTFIVFIVSLAVGKASIPFSEILHPTHEMTHNLIYNFRLPKSLTAVLIGIALPISGFLLQELFKNPLADPSVLGVTSLSGLGVAVVIFLFSLLGLDHWFHNSWLIILAAFSGAVLALLLIGSFAYRVRSSASLIILGFMLSGLASALIGVMQYFAPSEKIKSYLIWGFGSISGLSWEQLGIFFCCVVVGGVISLFSLKGITALLLGERYAMSLGVNLKNQRYLILGVTALLTASATAFAGPIAFIGLAIPHICRSLLKTGDMWKLYRWIVVSGVFTMLFFSIVVEIFPFGTLPINIITSLFGAPVVMSILLSNQQQIR